MKEYLKPREWKIREPEEHPRLAELEKLSARVVLRDRDLRVPQYVGNRCFPDARLAKTDSRRVPKIVNMEVAESCLLSRGSPSRVVQRKAARRSFESPRP